MEINSGLSFLKIHNNLCVCLHFELIFRFEVFDDDGRHGRDSSDDSIGVGYFSIEQLGIFSLKLDTNKE